LSEFSVAAGQQVSFVLSWSLSRRPPPSPIDGLEALKQVESVWSEWSSTYRAPDHGSDAVIRSLLTLKALSHWETGGIVAAGTTSLPEK
jgi:GH15 family glucan-1,4-alpha-glucosidase